MTLTLDQAVVFEIGRRIIILEDYAQSLSFFAFKRKAKARNQIGLYKIQLAQIRKNAHEVELHGKTMPLFNPLCEFHLKLLDYLATPEITYR